MYLSKDTHLKTELDSYKEKSNYENINLQNQLDEINLELKDLKRDYNYKDDELNIALNQIDNLKIQIENYKNEYQELLNKENNSFATSKSNSAALHEQIANLTEDVEQYQLIIKDKKSENNELVNKIELLNQDKRNLLTEKFKFENQIKEHHKHLEEIQYTTSKLNLRIQQLETEKKELIEANLLQQQFNSKKDKDLKDSDNEDNETISSFATEASSMDTFVGMSKSALKQKLKEFAEEIEELKQQNKSPKLAMNAEITALKKTLEEREKSLRNAEETIFKQKDVIEEMTSIQQSAEEAIINEMKTYQSESELHFAALKEELNTSHKVKKELEKQISSTNAQIEDYQKEVEELKNKLEQHNQESSQDLQDQIKALQQENEDLHERLNETDAIEEAIQEKENMARKLKMAYWMKEFFQGFGDQGIRT